MATIPMELVPGAHTIVQESTTELEVLGPGKSVLKKRTVITLLNEQSWANDLVLPYSSMNKIESISANMYNSAGKLIEKYKANDFQDRSRLSNVSIFDDFRMKYLDCTYNSYPYTIEFEYTIRDNDIIDYLDYLPQNGYGVAVMYSSYSISHPNDLPVRYKVLNFEPKYDKTSSSSITTHKWTVENMKALKSEYMDPDPFEILPQILVAPTHFEASGFHGDMSTWNSYGKWYRRLNQNRDQVSPEMAAKVKSLVKDVSDDREKVEIIYRYMQSQVRYVSIQLGIGGWQTFEASYVEENKYGDCKALTNYMKS
ncbi:MAG: DUF3857 domain-containing protein, partial [Bacteroidota bacterium]